MIFLNHHWKFHVVLINHLKISLAISSITLEIPYPQPPVLLVVPTGGKRGGSPLHLPKICSSPTPRTWRNPPPDFSSFPTKSQLPPFFDTQFMLILILIDVQLLVFTECCFQSKPLRLLLRFSLLVTPPSKVSNSPKLRQNLLPPFTAIWKTLLFLESAIFFLHYAKYQKNTQSRYQKN